MGKNANRWIRLYDLVEAIPNVNVYIEPVNGEDLRPPFAILRPAQLRNIEDTAQGCSIINGLYITVTVGVSTVRDKKAVQKNEISECINLFDTIQGTIELMTEGTNPDIDSDVVGSNDNIYKISYSGYFNK